MRTSLRDMGLGVVVAAAMACGGSEQQRVDAAVPVGTLIVEWSLMSAEGEPLSCEDAGAGVARVRIGGPAKDVPCAEGRAIFERELEGTRPVTVELLLGTVVLASARDNAEVVGGEERTIALVIVVGRRDPTVGSVMVRWRIDGRPAGTRCGEVGGAVMEIEELSGSRSEVDVSEPCTSGEVSIADLPQGGYTLSLRLLDEGGGFIAGNSSQSFTVSAGVTEMLPPVDIITEGGIEPGRILARYTINATTAAVGCVEEPNTQVVLRVTNIEQMGPAVSNTSTAACALGEVALGGLNSGAYTARVQLSHSALGVLTSTVVTPVTVARGRTSTITVDLSPP